MNRIRVVQRCLEQTDGRTYVEIGVDRGLCFAWIRAAVKIAVDPQLKITGWRRRLSERRAAACHYVAVESDEFFARHAAVLCPSGIDVAFIDGLHTWEQALRDAENALAHLKDGGLIVMHDCNPKNPIIADPAVSFEDFRKAHPRHDEWSGDVWKAIVLLRASRRDLDVAVLDCDYGIALVRRGEPETALDIPMDVVPSLGYEDLKRDRAHLLNLRPPRYLREFLRRRAASIAPVS